MGEFCERITGACIVPRQCGEDAECPGQICNQALRRCEPKVCTADSECIASQVCRFPDGQNNGQTDGGTTDGGSSQSKGLCIERERAFRYTGGCTLTQGAAPPTLPLCLLSISLLLLPGVIRRRKGRSQRPLDPSPLLLIALALALPKPAAAQTTPTSVNVVTLRPAFGPSNFITVEGTGTARAWSPISNVLFEYGFRPLSLSDRLSGTNTAVVDHLVTAHVGVGMGFTRYLQATLHVPLTLYLGYNQASNTLDINLPQSISAFGVADLRLSVKGRILNNDNGGLGLSVLPQISFPTGDGQKLRGDDAFGFEPKVALDYRFRKGILLGVNASFFARTSAQEVFNVRLDHQVRYGVGALVPLPKGLGLVGEVAGAVGVTKVAASYGSLYSPLFGLLGIRYTHPSGLNAQVGGGGSFISGPGEPLFRLFASVGYMPKGPAPIQRVSDPQDPEPGKGKADSTCGPFRTRNKDGICMDADQDQDGVVDRLDKCPTQAGSAEDSGCLPKDTDRDGMADRLDKCPDKAGPADNSGCPDLDADKDGIFDRYDRCVDAAGPSENGGCPDLDSDKDGLVDRLDKCPTEAGVADLAGCPDPDKDKDGIVDRQDKCPDKPGKAEQNGCPLVEIQGASVRLLAPIRFVPGGAALDKSSQPVIVALAEALKGQSGIETLRVNAGAPGPGKKPGKLADRRVIVLTGALINAGVAEEILEVNAVKGGDEINGASVVRKDAPPEPVGKGLKGQKGKKGKGKAKVGKGKKGKKGAKGKGKKKSK